MKRARLIGLIIALTVSGLSSVAASSAEPTDPITSLLPRQPGANPLGDGPSGPADPGAPLAFLGRATEALRTLRASVPPYSATLDRVLNDADAAGVAYRGGKGGLQEVMSKLREATADLTAIPPTTNGEDRAVIDESGKNLARTGGAIARRLLDVARHAGVDDARINSVERKIIEAEAQLDNNAYDSAAAGFEESSGWQWSDEWILFDLDTFEKNVKAAFEIEPGSDQGSAWEGTHGSIGFAYAIAQGTNTVRTGSQGWARTPDDLWQDSMTPTTPMMILSAGKNITATGVLWLLDHLNVSPDSSIAPWLPSTWTKGPGISTLTFADLLTHHSGLGHNQNGNDDYFALRLYVQVGVTASDKAQWTYQNANFTLLGLLIARLWPTAQPLWQIFDLMDDNALSANTAYLIYQEFIRQAILLPSGVDRYCFDNPGDPTWAYEYPFAFYGVYFHNTQSLDCAAGGWRLSATDVASFLEHRTFDNNVMSPASRSRMKNKFYGLMDPANYGADADCDGAFGTYQCHGGDVFYAGGLNRPLGAHTCIISYQYFNIQAVVLMNANGGLFGEPNHPEYQCSALETAYDDAWIAT